MPIARIMAAAVLSIASVFAARTEETQVELDPQWTYIADRVMGGVSTGRMDRETVEGRAAARLTGQVSLANNGGFIQMAFDFKSDASGWTGLELDVLGNCETYELRLKTDALTRPWQSFRAAFAAPPHWQTVRFAFADLEPYRTQATLEPTGVRRVGLLAVGRAFEADLAVAVVRLYR